MLSTDKFIEKARKVHGNKYDYSKVDYKNSLTNICIICPEHGEFWQRPSSHLAGHTCLKCADLIRNNSRKYNKEKFIEKSIQVHGNKYDYSKVDYKNKNTKVCIICPKHGEFWQKPENHYYGHGCPVCNESKLEKTVREALIDNNIYFIRSANKGVFNWLGKQHLDFYLPNYNIAIECQGIQHYKPVDFSGHDSKNLFKIFKTVKDRDCKKYSKCKENGVELLYFTEEKFSKNTENTYTNIEKLINKILY